MRLSTQLYLMVICGRMKDKIRIQLSEKYKEETLLKAEDDLYLD